MQRFNSFLHLFDKDQVQEHLLQGYNLKFISEKTGIPHRRLGEMVSFYRLEKSSVRSIKRKNHNYFNNIDTETKAYILGFILADGCVNIEDKKKNGVVYGVGKRLSFCNSVDDIEIINTIQRELSPDSPVKLWQNNKGAVNRKQQCMLRISSSQIIDDLIQLGIKPQKTKDVDFTFDFTKIPENLIRHFVRGFFDGDGHLSKSKAFQLVGTSKPFLLQLQSLFSFLFPIIKSTIRQTQGKNMIWYVLTLNCGHGKHNLISEYFYKDSSIYLQRKHKYFMLS